MSDHDNRTAMRAGRKTQRDRLEQRMHGLQQQLRELDHKEAEEREALEARQRELLGALTFGAVRAGDNKVRDALRDLLRRQRPGRRRRALLSDLGLIEPEPDGRTDGPARPAASGTRAR